jgi:radical SAM superfamily enzyme
MSFNVPAVNEGFLCPNKQNRKVLQGCKNVGEQNTIKGVGL